ncbi:MAG: glycosyltransferase family protein [Thermodesulfobacteriota bacterium]|nr:glycosyltransferase family protein [Thermodesulfobacteriota bacterium]
MNAGIIITARLKSTRLPKKVIRRIMGRPMICHMLDRLKLARYPQRIVICTSTASQDDPLEEIAAQESVCCFRGHPDDVLERMTSAADEFKLDVIVSCTADNPFVDPIYIDRLVHFHLRHNYDYSKTLGLPWGTFSYVLCHRAMVRACEIKAERDTEVWGGYFTGHDEFSCGVLKVDDSKVSWPELRLTVDTPEDFELVSRIFENLYRPSEVFPLSSIVDLCRRRPDLVEINKHISQKPGRPIRLKPGTMKGTDVTVH